MTHSTYTLGHVGAFLSLTAFKLTKLSSLNILRLFWNLRIFLSIKKKSKIHYVNSLRKDANLADSC